MEFNELLIEIKREALNLRKLFLTEEEQEKIRSVLDGFDRSMHQTAVCTVKHMEMYRQYGWKELYFEEENDYEESDRTQNSLL